MDPLWQPDENHGNTPHAQSRRALRPRKPPRPEYQMAIFLENLTELPVPVLETEPSPLAQPPPVIAEMSMCTDYSFASNGNQDNRNNHSDYEGLSLRGLEDEFIREEEHSPPGPYGPVSQPRKEPERLGKISSLPLSDSSTCEEEEYRGMRQNADSRNACERRSEVISNCEAGFVRSEKVSGDLLVVEDSTREDTMSSNPAVEQSLSSNKCDTDIGIHNMQNNLSCQRIAAVLRNANKGNQRAKKRKLLRQGKSVVRKEPGDGSCFVHQQVYVTSARIASALRRIHLRNRRSQRRKKDRNAYSNPRIMKDNAGASFS